MNLHRMLSSAEVRQLERLTESERQALILLAEGHTVKSIAAQTGHSVGAINERLRQARRKTGASSSRELARLVKAQKVGDEKIGMASDEAPMDALPPHRNRGGRRAMATVIIGGMAALTTIGALVLQAGGTSDVPRGQAQPDEILGRAMEELSQGQPHDVYKRLRSEARDPAWAPNLETMLKERYSRISHVSGPENHVRVACRMTLCEVAGWIDLPDPKAKAEYDKFNLVMDALQGPGLRKDLETFGLENPSASFGQGSRARPDRSTFVMYWRRKPPVDQAAQNPQADDLLGPLVGTAGPEPRQLHATVRSEKRDQSWAPRMEAALQTQFSKVPRIGDPSNPVRVICGSSFCEVAAVVADERASPAEMKSTAEALNGEMLNAQKALGLEHVTSGYVPTASGRTSYFAYLRRKTG